MSVVIGVRVPQRLKEELEELGINYAEEIRRFLERRVREERARRLIEEIESFRRGVKPIGFNLSAEAIREDRDRGWGSQ